MTLPFSGGLLGFGSSATQGASPFHWVELGRKKLTSDGDRVLVTGANADATYTGDMSTGWTTSNAGSGFTLDGTNDEIDFLNNYSNDNVAIDLNSLVSGSISTSKWVIRFAIEMSGTASGDNIIWWNGVSSDESVQANSTAQSFIGSGNQTINGTTGTRTYLNMCNDGRLDQSTVQTRLQSGGSDVSDFTGKHYFEIIRDGSNFTVNQYSDAYTTLYGSKTNAVSNEGGGTLRYFISANYQQGSNVTGTLSEFKFYNGISSIAGDLASKPYIQILAHNFNTGAVRSGIRFNEDSNNNYTGARSVNGSTTQHDNNGISRMVSDLDIDGSDFTVATFINDTSMEKLGTLYRAHQSGSGATNTPEREEMAVKWANSTESIGKVESINTETGSFASGSECVVLGYDPDAEEGTQFWEQLKSVELSSSDEIDYGDFDGSNDHISFGTKFDEMQQEGSFSVWIKPDNAGAVGNDIIFDNSDYSSLNNGFGIRISDPSGGKAICSYGIWGSTDSSISTSAIWTSSEWQHLVVTYDGTTGKIYRNGTLVKSGALTANSGTATYNARLGFSANGNDHRFHGKMSQALVYNDALTSTEVTALYNNGTPTASPSTSGLISWYKLDGNANDSHGSNNGTNTGVSFGSEMPNILDSGDFSTSVSHDLGGEDITALTWVDSGKHAGSDANSNANTSYLTYKQITGLTSGATITHATFDVYSCSNTDFKVGIYTDSSNQPSTLLQNSGNNCVGEITGKTISNTYTTVEVKLDYPATVPSNGKVWVAVIPSTTDSNFRVTSGSSSYTSSVYATDSTPSGRSTNYANHMYSTAPITGNGANNVRFGVRGVGISTTSDTFYILEDTTNDLIDIKATGNCGQHDSPTVGYGDLGTTLSTSDWMVRFKLKFNTVTAESSGGKSFFTNFFIVDDGSQWDTTENGFGFRFIADAGSTQTQFYSITSGTPSGSSMGYTPATGNTLYVQISWSGGTATAKFFTDDSYSTQTGNTVTRSGTFSGLRYSQVALRQDTGGNGVMDIEMSKLKVWNGNSSDTSSKKYLWVQTHIPQSSNHHGYLYFNGDDGSTNNNYARRGSSNGGASDFTNADDDEINWSHDTNTSKYLNMFIVNDPTKEKLALAHYADYGGSGSGNAPNRMEFAYKWDNTSDPIKSIRLYNQYSGTTLPTGTRLIVWGAD